MYLIQHTLAERGMFQTLWMVNLGQGTGAWFVEISPPAQLC